MCGVCYQPKFDYFFLNVNFRKLWNRRAHYMYLHFALKSTPSSTVLLLTFRISLVQPSPRLKWPRLKAWLSIFSVVKLLTTKVGHMVSGAKTKYTSVNNMPKTKLSSFVLWQCDFSSKMSRQRPCFYNPITCAGIQKSKRKKLPPAGLKTMEKKKTVRLEIVGGSLWE